MLARANRIVDGRDYRLTVRRGSRVVHPNTVTYVAATNDHEIVRFGFIVAKNVGIAVVRNRLRRRLKAACFDLHKRAEPGTDVVIRALPNARVARWTTLRDEISQALVGRSGTK